MVEADLLDEQSIINAIEQSTYIVHTASPVMTDIPKDENLLIKPAVNGTVAVMKAAHINKVKRVVITSSVAAIYITADKSKKFFNENDWTDTKIATAYERSKTFAEKAAWEFIDNLPDDEKFDLVTINPGMVLGPNLNEAQFAVGDVVKKIMMN